MSYSSVQHPSCPPPPLPINLSNSKYSSGGEVKEEELGQSQIKRHTIDAILGLPRLGGFCLEEEGESGELDLEEQRAKQKFHLERDGEYHVGQKRQTPCNHFEKEAV